MPFQLASTRRLAVMAIGTGSGPSDLPKPGPSAAAATAAAIVRREQEEKAQKEQLDPLQGGFGTLREDPQSFFTLDQHVECLTFFKVRHSRPMQTHGHQIQYWPACYVY